MSRPESSVGDLMLRNNPGHSCVCAIGPAWYDGGGPWTKLEREAP